MTTLGDYTRNCQIQEAVGNKFKHRKDGRSYVLENVKQTGNFKQIFIVTNKGVRIPLDECLEDVEIENN